MTKTVLFYARYSTDRQNEVSIETQVELGRKFVADRGWNLVEIYSDAAVSGTNLKHRPGIQALMRRVKAEQIDVVLCVTVDRLSRDIEHSHKILKELRYREVELWTVHGGTAVTDLEMSFRAMLSHELVGSIRYRTREGMKTANRKGKATTNLSYGYRLSRQRDENGDRIKGLREIDPDKAKIVVRIFKEYAQGVAPAVIAERLNAEGIPAPRVRYWRDCTIRGWGKRGTGLINNESYIGRVIWNRQTFRKNPETEKRTPRLNDVGEWIVDERPHMRIVSDELWDRVKERQALLGEDYQSSKTNKLNGTHRPRYLLSGLVECAVCGGPYAVMAKDRYGCTNRKKRLPVDELDGIRCPNSKTVLREELEDRVLSCLPVAFFSMNLFDKVSDQLICQEIKDLNNTPSRRDELEGQLDRLSREQQAIVQQLRERAAEGRPRLPALDDALDDLELKRVAVAREVEALPKEAEDLTARVEEVRSKFDPMKMSVFFKSLLNRTPQGDATWQDQWMDVVRQFIQKVVVGPTPGHQPTSLEVHGFIATIMASLEMEDVLLERFLAQSQAEYERKLAAGELDAEDKRKKLLDGYIEELQKRSGTWGNLQVSVVAGAGFEPAAFRL